MSGGHYDYAQGHIHSIIETLERDIAEGVGTLHPATLHEMRRGLRALRLAALYTQRIDWMMSGDDGEQSFHTRLSEELSDLDIRHPAIPDAEAGILTQGFLSEMPDGIVIEMSGGSCPYQISGTLDGLPFYFKARGSRWFLAVDPKDPVGPRPQWIHQQPHEEAGHITDLEAKDLFLRAVYRFRAERPTLS